MYVYACYCVVFISYDMCYYIISSFTTNFQTKNI